jgi:hypothetical protein
MVVFAAFLLGVMAASTGRSQSLSGDPGVAAIAPSYAADLKPGREVLPPEGPLPD